MLQTSFQKLTYLEKALEKLNIQIIQMLTITTNKIYTHSRVFISSNDQTGLEQSNLKREWQRRKLQRLWIIYLAAAWYYWLNARLIDPYRKYTWLFFYRGWLKKQWERYFHYRAYRFLVACHLAHLETPMDIIAHLIFVIFCNYFPEIRSRIIRSIRWIFGRLFALILIFLHYLAYLSYLLRKKYITWDEYTKLKNQAIDQKNQAIERVISEAALATQEQNDSNWFRNWVRNLARFFNPRLSAKKLIKKFRKFIKRFWKFIEKFQKFDFKMASLALFLSFALVNASISTVGKMSPPIFSTTQNIEPIQTRTLGLNLKSPDDDSQQGKEAIFKLENLESGEGQEQEQQVSVEIYQYLETEPEVKKPQLNQGKRQRLKSFVGKNGKKLLSSVSKIGSYFV